MSHCILRAATESMSTGAGMAAAPGVLATAANGGTSTTIGDSIGATKGDQQPPTPAQHVAACAQSNAAGTAGTSEPQAMSALPGSTMHSSHTCSGAAKSDGSVGVSLASAAVAATATSLTEDSSTSTQREQVLSERPKDVKEGVFSSPIVTVSPSSTERTVVAFSVHDHEEDSKEENSHDPSGAPLLRAPVEARELVDAGESLVTNERPLGMASPTATRIIMNDQDIDRTAVELTCQVMVDGENKSVTFSMDFAQDTPEAVAREMIEELQMVESVETLSDIMAQINSFRPDTVLCPATMQQLPLSATDEQPRDLCASDVPSAAVLQATVPLPSLQQQASQSAPALTQQLFPPAHDAQHQQTTTAAKQVPPQAVGPAATAPGVALSLQQPAQKQVPGAAALTDVADIGGAVSAQQQQPLFPQAAHISAGSEHGYAQAPNQRTAPGISASTVSYAQAASVQPLSQAHVPSQQVQSQTQATPLPTLPQQPGHQQSQPGHQQPTRSLLGSVVAVPSSEFDDLDEGDMDDKDILRTIEIQQQREIEEMQARVEEMRERHRQQNVKMRNMIRDRRQKEKQEAAATAASATAASVHDWRPDWASRRREP